MRKAADVPPETGFRINIRRKGDNKVYGDDLKIISPAPAAEVPEHGRVSPDGKKGKLQKIKKILTSALHTSGAKGLQ